ncbi:MAG TPA: molybdopterin cofactor-binding domain-containing protein [Candidatus Binatia bacterium]|nr:molybdopterin cofactor-binding domain-containing protein [Candidatus Binatia bacterium]
MDPDPDRELALELEQHEAGSILRCFEMERRDFLKLLGGGILVCMSASSGAAQESGRMPGSHELPKDIAAWLHIAGDGHVTVFTGKVEMGQNIRTSLAQQVAEELRVPLESISMVMGDTQTVPWDMGTFGSRTTPTMGPQLRTMAAAARETLLNQAAEQWKVDPSGLTASDGRITNPRTNQSLSYGELTHGQKLVKVVESAPGLTPAAQWKTAGQPLPKVDGRAFVTGQHHYPSDIDPPGMVSGKVLRPAAFRATLVSLDDNAARHQPGVAVVRDGDFVGVTASDMWSAEQALAALKAQWKAPPQISDRELFGYLKANTDKGESEPPKVTGSVEKALAAADVRLSQSYTVAYIQHAPLEPRAAVAEWDGDRLTVWTGTQRPFAVRDELAAAFHIPSQNVRVLVPDTGSAYGGKHTGDAAVEAARLARAAGKPVRLVWTREEEFTWAYFRPAGVIEIRSGAQRDGTITAWECHNFNSGPSAIDTPYNVANRHIQFHPVDAPLRQGSYRALAATANHFARESHMDELSHATAKDPLEFRLKNTRNDRLRAVLEAAAEKAAWSRHKSTPERAFGIAGGIEKGGHIAAVAEVEIGPQKSVRVVRVVEAFDCGAVVNPNGLRNQIAGAIMMGMGGALFEAIRFDNGRILNPRFSQYRVPRFSDMPQIEVVLVDRKDLPSAGAGETPIVGIAPAIANAIFAATGERLRSLPLRTA